MGISPVAGMRPVKAGVPRQLIASLATPPDAFVENYLRRTGDGMEPRSAVAAGKDFPYESPTTCYIEVRQDGSVTQGVGQGAYERARSGESRIFAVWSGQWRSDLFIIDDLDEYAKAVGLVDFTDRRESQMASDLR